MRPIHYKEVTWSGCVFPQNLNVSWVNVPAVRVLLEKIMIWSGGWMVYGHMCILMNWIDHYKQNTLTLVVNIRFAGIARQEETAAAVLIADQRSFDCFFAHTAEVLSM